MSTDAYAFCQLNKQGFYCETCDVRAAHYSVFVRHLSTRSHKMLTDRATVLPTQTTVLPTQQNREDTKNRACQCGLSYASRQSLYRHKKTCTWKPLVADTSSNNTDVLVRILETQSKILETQSQLIESQAKAAENNALVMQQMATGLANTMTLASAGTSTINSNNNNTNSNNKSFNLQFFLNTTCKDAMSATEFINQLQITFADLENIANNGYEEGIYTVISNKLSTMAVHERPFHCTDLKRETIYIKDKDEWTMDDHKKKMKHIIHSINHKNKVVGKKWVNSTPNAEKLDSDENVMMNKLVEQIYALPVDQEEKSQEKIIKKLAKDVRVEK